MAQIHGTETLCHRWGVILAGGDGKRLLPLTRRVAGDDRPKQFCCVFGAETLLQETRSRVSRMIAPERILLVLTRTHESFYRGELGDVAPSRTFIQPFNRGTAPAILSSLTCLRDLDANALVAFFPSDHYFADDAALHRHIDAAFTHAESHPGLVILLGISPETPEVEYGWIQPGAAFREGADNIYHVSRFWEKPSQSLACSLMRLGCLWNSFIMVGHVQAFLDLTKRALPVLFRSFSEPSGPDFTDERSVNCLYSRIVTANYSQQVLSVCTTELAVLRAEGLGWSDLGHPGRVLSILERKGVTAHWIRELVAQTGMVRA